MSRGVIIHLDNDKEGVLNPSKHLFEQTGLDLEYIICETKAIFEEEVKENNDNIKVLIFDLLSSNPSADELHQHDAEFIDNVHYSFSRLNIPIFVYSGYLQALEGKYESDGTVFKIDKEKGFGEILTKITKFQNSGFLDVFSPNGELNKLLLNDLHLSFTKQFNSNNQIEEIIDSISVPEGDDPVNAHKKFFNGLQ